MGFQTMELLTLEDKLKIIDIVVKVILGLIGFYFTNNYRRQVKQKAADSRLESYAKLWTLMEPARPVQETDETYYKPEKERAFPYNKRKLMHEQFTKWYYENGNGMFLGDSTRQMYLQAKHNLVCPDDKIKPKILYDRNLEGKTAYERKKCRSHLSIRQLSLLRARMRADIEVYGGLYFGNLHDDDKDFLKECNESLWKRPWLKLPWRKDFGGNELTEYNPCNENEPRNPNHK